MNNDRYYARLDASHQKRLDEDAAAQIAQEKEATCLVPLLTEGNSFSYNNKTWSFEDVLEYVWEHYESEMRVTLHTLYLATHKPAGMEKDLEIKSLLIMLKVGFDKAINNLSWDMADGIYERQKELQEEARHEANMDD